MKFGATDANATGGKGRVRNGDRRHPVLCLSQLGKDMPEKRCINNYHLPPDVFAGGRHSLPRESHTVFC